MKIYTLNVGQGQFVVVVGDKEAFVVDTYFPLDPKVDIVNIKAALAKILQGKTWLVLLFPDSMRTILMRLACELF